MQSGIKCVCVCLASDRFGLAWLLDLAWYRSSFGLVAALTCRSSICQVRHTRKCASKLLTTRRMRNAGPALPCPVLMSFRPTFAYAQNLSWLRHFNCKLAWRVSFAVASSLSRFLPLPLCVLLLPRSFALDRIQSVHFAFCGNLNDLC